jgi:hypothetical protein
MTGTWYTEKGLACKLAWMQEYWADKLMPVGWDKNGTPTEG